MDMFDMQLQHIFMFWLKIWLSLELFGECLLPSEGNFRSMLMATL